LKNAHNKRQAVDAFYEKIINKSLYRVINVYCTSDITKVKEKKEEKTMDENRYNTKVRLAMSERLKKCSKDKYESERRIIDINDTFLTKSHELSYTEACELIEERKRLEKDIERLTIERELWDAAREICLDIADEMCKKKG
jgi:hypothetical protein